MTLVAMVFLRHRNEKSIKKNLLLGNRKAETYDN